MNPNARELQITDVHVHVMHVVRSHQDSARLYDGTLPHSVERGTNLDYVSRF